MKIKKNIKKLDNSKKVVMIFAQTFVVLKKQ